MTFWCGTSSIFFPQIHIKCLHLTHVASHQATEQHENRLIAVLLKVPSLTPQSKTSKAALGLKTVCLVCIIMRACHIS